MIFFLLELGLTLSQVSVFTLLSAFLTPGSGIRCG
jgi:hypothetical protein